MWCVVFSCGGFSCGGAQALECAASVGVVLGFSCPAASGIWVPGPGIEPVSPALAGGFLTTEPLFYFKSVKWLHVENTIALNLFLSLCLMHFYPFFVFCPDSTVYSHHQAGGGGLPSSLYYQLTLPFAAFSGYVFIFLPSFLNTFFLECPGIYKFFLELD